MQILLISLFKQVEGKECIRVCYAEDLSSFSFFQRGTIREHVHFGARTVAQRTRSGTRAVVSLTDIPYIVHCYVRHDGLTGAVMTDKEYPERQAMSLIIKSMNELDKHSTNWTRVNVDQDASPQFMIDDLARFQDPHAADKLTQIQKQLDDIKDIMHQNIEQLLANGETVEILMERSQDLSASSVSFYRTAKKNNQCCKAY